jgi:hypothetical protein
MIGHRRPIIDETTLGQIQPEQLRAYLQVQGWQQGAKIAEGRGQVWRLQWQLGQGFGLDNSDANSNGELDDRELEWLELLVPLKPGLKDHNSRVLQILDTLEMVGNRSQVQIVQDLLARVEAQVVELVGERSAVGRVP